MEQHKYDVFISYSRKDYVGIDGNVLPNNIISKIMNAFKADGISYWFDEEGIYSGAEFASIITKAIRNSHVFLFISSANSNESKWTSNEISTALEFNKTIIPFRLDKSPYNDSIMMKIVSLDYVDCKDEKKAMNKLLRAVKYYLPKPDKPQWRNLEVPERARKTIVGFYVDGEWKNNVFTTEGKKQKYKNELFPNEEQPANGEPARDKETDIHPMITALKKRKLLWYVIVSILGAIIGVLLAFICDT